MFNKRSVGVGCLTGLRVGSHRYDKSFCLLVGRMVCVKSCTNSQTNLLSEKNNLTNIVPVQGCTFVIIDLGKLQGC